MKWYEWTRYLRDECDAPPDVKAFLVTLSTWADGDGRCYPSLKTLADKLGIHPDTAKRRRNRAVRLGWLVVESPGRWHGTPTRYRLQRKGGVHAPLRTSERGASVGAKGVHEDGVKGGVGAPRTSITFHEGDDGAPSMEARTSPLERRRDSARAVRKAGPYRDRFLATFQREYGHLYPSKGPRVLRPMHPAMASIVNEGRPAA